MTTQEQVKGTSGAPSAAPDGATGDSSAPHTNGANPSSTERDEALRSLWQATPKDLIGKLPRYTGPKDTPKSQRERKSCGECKGYHEFPSIHLDYLGHSDTCRLIAAVDPEWTWEPTGGWTDTGEPVFVRDHDGSPSALWIRLTVLGVTRPGVGTVGSGKSDPEKELIGDAIRNAAMRFGVGADLWSKATGGSLDDSGSQTYTRSRPAQTTPPDPDAWYKANGWKDAAEEATWHASRDKALEREAKDNPDATPAIQRWQRDHNLDWSRAVAKPLADEFDAFMVSLGEVAGTPAPTTGQLQYAPGEEPF